MGMGKAKKFAKGFKEATDKAVDMEVKQGSLFMEKLVESDLIYECIRQPEASVVTVGTKVRLIDLKNRIEVFIGGTPVGHVLTDQVDSIRSKLKLPKKRSRSVWAVVIDVSTISPTFVVRVGKR
jgi:hypothetical protein